MPAKKLIMLSLILLTFYTLFLKCDSGGKEPLILKENPKEETEIEKIMSALPLESPRLPSDELKTKLKSKFRKYSSIIKNKNICVLIDYDLPIIAYRLWIINMKNDSVILNSRVSHAYNSGLMFAEKFSNTPNTEKSCVGAFLTGDTYNGKYGYSMKLEGLEKGLNDKAMERNIVFHPHNALWSLGCYMTNEAINKKIIDKTKGGVLVYVRKTNPSYSNN